MSQNASAFLYTLILQCRVSAELIQAFCSAAVKEQEFALALLRPVSVSGGSEMSEPKNDVSEKVE